MEKKIHKGIFSNFRNRFQCENGFTLAELIIVVAIIVILSSIVLANHREGQKQFSLHRSASKLAQDLRNVQNKATIGETFYNDFPSGGYGIYFIEDSDSYIVYADCNNNKEYDGGSLTCSDCTSGSCNPNIVSEKVEEIYLEEGVKVVNLVVGSPLHITFFPPDPTITIRSGGNNFVSASIVLSIRGNSDTVFINNIGLIDID